MIAESKTQLSCLNSPTFPIITLSTGRRHWLLEATKVQSPFWRKRKRFMCTTHLCRCGVLPVQGSHLDALPWDQDSHAARTLAQGQHRDSHWHKACFLDSHWHQPFFWSHTGTRPTPGRYNVTAVAHAGTKPRNLSKNFTNASGSPPTNRALAVLFQVASPV